MPSSTWVQSSPALVPPEAAYLTALESWSVRVPGIEYTHMSSDLAKDGDEAHGEAWAGL